MGFNSGFKGLNIYVSNDKFSFGFDAAPCCLVQQKTSDYTSTAVEEANCLGIIKCPFSVPIIYVVI